MKSFMLLLAIFFGAATSRAKEVGGAVQKDRLQTDAMHGMRMSAADAKGLEDEISKNPEDLSARAKLLGYYFMKQRSSSDVRDAYRGHVLWIIEQHPESEIAGTPYCELDGISDPDGYHDAKALWLEQTKKHGKEALILGHAAQFFFLHDKELAEKLLQQAKDFEPKNPKWSDLLGHLYALQHQGGSGAKALAELERAESVDTSDESKSVRLVDLAKTAYDAGQLEKAKHYAEELLKPGTKDPQNWNYGNAIHHGNNVLGRIALQQGQIPQANEYLLKAGDMPGSPQLNSFGPNMSLAKELLEAGQKDTVLQYFAECRKFWKRGGNKLDEWTKQVTAGELPEFGANLVY